MQWDEDNGDVLDEMEDAQMGDAEQVDELEQAERANDMGAAANGAHRSEEAVHAAAPQEAMPPSRNAAGKRPVGRRPAAAVQQQQQPQSDMERRREENMRENERMRHFLGLSEPCIPRASADRF